MNVMENIKQRAAADPKTVVFPESGEPAVLELVARLVELGIAKPVLLGDPSAIRGAAADCGVDLEGVTIEDATDEARKRDIAEAYSLVCPFISIKGSLRRMKDPLVHAMMLARLGVVDAVAAGRVYSTGDVVLSGQTYVGYKQGIKTASSLGVLDVPGFAGSEGTLVGVTDCAVNAFPSAEELADIALASADTVSTLFGWEPRIAMLGFSTKGSSGREEQEKLAEAVSIARERCPQLAIDGEMQLDSAINPAVASRKIAWESPVAGKANVLVFPDLNAGNIGVKLVQNFAHANAYGPILQGFAKPITDFSRGAPLEEMVGNVAMLVVRAQSSN